MFKRWSPLLLSLGICLAACGEPKEGTTPPKSEPAESAKQETPVAASNVAGPVGAASELSLSKTAASDRSGETGSVGTYIGFYGAKLTSVISTQEPGSAGIGNYCLKVETLPGVRSGVAQKDGLIMAEPGKTYEISCTVFNPGTKPEYIQMCLQREKAPGGLWAKSVKGSNQLMAVAPGKWTTLQGLVSVPANASGKSALVIINSGPEPPTWYIDDISVKEHQQ